MCVVLYFWFLPLYTFDFSIYVKILHTDGYPMFFLQVLWTATVCRPWQPLFEFETFLLISGNHVKLCIIVVGSLSTLSNTNPPNTSEESSRLEPVSRLGLWGPCGPPDDRSAPWI